MLIHSVFFSWIGNSSKTKNANLLTHFDDEYGERVARDSAGNTYMVPGDMTYKEWREKQNKLLTKDNNKNDNIVIPKGYDIHKHSKEIECANLIQKEIGGNVTMINEDNNMMIADMLWNDKLWELKGVTSKTSIDNAVRHGLKQITENPGGIILNIDKCKLKDSDIVKYIEDRLNRSKINIKELNVIFVRDKSIYKQLEIIKKEIATSTKTGASSISLQQNNTIKIDKSQLKNDDKNGILFRYIEENRYKLRNNLPKGYVDKRNIGVKILHEELEKFVDYATKNGIQIGTVDNKTGGFDEYCGDVKVLYEYIDKLSDYKLEKIILKYDNVLGYDNNKSAIDIGAFAETRGNTIMLNKFMFDDTSFMKNAYRDSANKGEFVKGSTYLNIIDHEVMHLKSMKNKARKLFKKFIEKNDKKGYNIKEIIKNNISRYAIKVNYLTNEFVELASELNVLKIIDNDKFNKLLEE